MALLLGSGGAWILVTGGHEASATIAESLTAEANQPLSLAATKSISYMPVDAPWTSMWLHFDSKTIDNDFGRLAGLGANTVRLIVSPTTFGFPTVSPPMAQELSEVMALAAGHGLHVELTLFDWFGNYSATVASEQWMSSLLTRFRDDPQIAFIELKNEIDPYDSQAMSWARAMIPSLRKVVGDVPVTVSTPGDIGLPGLQSLKDSLAPTPLDFFDFHYYGTAGDAYATFKAAKSIAAPTPLLIGETGMSTYAGSGGSKPSLESQQASLFSITEKDATALGLPAVEPWMLNDVESADLPAVERGQGDLYQCYFGLYRTNGSAKPAAAIVQEAFTSANEPLLLDSGFATASSGLPTGWSPSGPGKTGWSPATGSQSASVSITKSGSQTAWTQTMNTTSITAGERVQVTAWAKGTDSTGANQVALSWYGSNDKYLGNTASSRLPPGNTNWIKLGADATAPSGADSAVVYLQSASNTGTVQFGNVSATVLGTAPFPALPAVPETSGVGPTLTNPWFASGSNDVTTAWSATGSGQLNWSPSWEGHPGSASVAITGSGAQAAWTQAANIGAISSGEKIQSTAWVKGTKSTGSNMVAIAWYGPSGNYLGNDTSRRLPSGDTNWIKLGADATAPAGAALGVVSLQSRYNTGTVQFGSATATIITSADFPALPSVPETSGVGPTLTDVGFETGTSGLPSGWVAEGSGAKIWSHVDAHTGSRSVAISQSGSQAAWIQTANLGFTPAGEKVKVTAWAQGSGSSGSNLVAVSWYGPTGRYLGNAMSGNLPRGNTGWMALTVTGTAPAGAAYADVYLQSSWNAGTVHFDDVSLSIL